jgi:hypothetical protein
MTDLLTPGLRREIARRALHNHRKACAVCPLDGTDGLCAVGRRLAADSSNPPNLP